MKESSLTQRFGWLYDLRTIPTDNKQYQLLVNKYFFYFSRKSNGIIYLSFSQSFKYNNSSLITSTPSIINKTELENEVKQIMSIENYNENMLFDIFEKYNNSNYVEGRKSIFNHYCLKLIKLNGLEVENELSEIDYFFKNKNQTVDDKKCIIAKSNTYLTSTFLIQNLYNSKHTQSLLNTIKYMTNCNDQSKLGILRSRTLTKNMSVKSRNSFILNNTPHNPNSKKIEEMNDKLKNKLNSLYFCQNNWEEKKICIKEENKNDEPNSNLSTMITNNNHISNKYRASSLIIKEEWVELTNTSFYSGDVKNNCPNGFGKEYRSDGLIYDGTFMNGKWHGVGTVTNENLDSTTAEYINGRVCGI
jgi:hypothetical protein